MGDVTLSFVKPHGRYNDLTLENENSADQIVKRFELDYPPQKPMAHITRRIAVTRNMGSNELPGGNKSWIPVVEFHELNGRILPANKVTPFIMPPTNSKNYLELDAAVFDITFETVPANAALKAIDGMLKTFKLRNHVTKQRYLVMDNLWIPTRAISVAEAVRLACRDDDALSNDLCPTHAGS